MAVGGGSWETDSRYEGNEGMGSENIQWPQSWVDLPRNREDQPVFLLERLMAMLMQAPASPPPGTSQGSCSTLSLTPPPSLALSGSPK